MDKLTNLEQLRAASLAAKGLIGEVAGATAEALGEMAEALEDLAAQQQGSTLTISATGGGDSGGSGGGIPSGLVAMWSGEADAVPDGWALCDGSNGTPDLRDRFVLGAGSSYSVGDKGGEETHKLTTSEIPRHSHDYTPTSYSANLGMRAEASRINNNTVISLSSSSSAGKSTTSVGSGFAHNNMPPYYVLCYIMKL